MQIIRTLDDEGSRALNQVRGLSEQRVLYVTAVYKSAKMALVLRSQKLTFKPELSSDLYFFFLIVV